jgi:hypothetical protein
MSQLLKYIIVRYNDNRYTQKINHVDMSVVGYNILIDLFSKGHKWIIIYIIVQHHIHHVIILIGCYCIETLCYQ